MKFQCSERFKGNLPFKCLACGRVDHYVAKSPDKDKCEKGKEYAKGNRKQVVNRRSYYIDEDSDGLSNNDEDGTEQDYRLLMAYDNDFLDALEKEKFHEEITKLKICVEENNMIMDTLTHQLAERENHNENLECGIVGLRKDLEKTKSINLRFAKGLETLNEIINVHRSPLIKTCLGYTEDLSQSQKSSGSTRSYLDVAKISEMYVNHQQKSKITHQVNHTQFTPRMNISRSCNQQVNNTKI